MSASNRFAALPLAGKPGEAGDRARNKAARAWEHRYAGERRTLRRPSRSRCPLISTPPFICRSPYIPCILTLRYIVCRGSSNFASMPDQQQQRVQLFVPPQEHQICSLPATIPAPHASADAAAAKQQQQQQWQVSRGQQRHIRGQHQWGLPQRSGQRQLASAPPQSRPPPPATQFCIPCFPLCDSRSGVARWTQRVNTTPGSTRRKQQRSGAVQPRLLRLCARRTCCARHISPGPAPFDWRAAPPRARGRAATGTAGRLLWSLPPWAARPPARCSTRRGGRPSRRTATRGREEGRQGLSKGGGGGGGTLCNPS